MEDLSLEERFIVFKFEKDGSLVYDKMSLEKVKTYKRSVLLDNLSSDKWDFTNSCDLTEFSHNSFRQILKYLDTGKLPKLSKDTLDDLLQLANFMIPDDVLSSIINVRSYDYFYIV
jgi:hypothetical protein